VTNDLVTWLRTVLDEVEATAARDLAGEPLTSGPDGDLRCRFDGWSWRKDGQVGQP